MISQMNYHIPYDLICSDNFLSDNAVFFWQAQLGLVKHPYFMSLRKWFKSNEEISVTGQTVQ